MQLLACREPHKINQVKKKGFKVNFPLLSGLPKRQVQLPHIISDFFLQSYRQL